MNPFLTANLRAERKLKAEVEQQQLMEIREKLAVAQPLLLEASELMSKIDGSYLEISSAIADALYYCGEGLYAIDHHPQPDEVYDVALNHLPPINGKVEAASPAFDAIEITDDFEF